MHWKVPVYVFFTTFFFFFFLSWRKVVASKEEMSILASGEGDEVEICL